MPKPDITVAICTFNGAATLPGVLQALLAQKGVEAARWEVLLVDNGSTDETKDVFTCYSMRSAGVLWRYVQEPTPGTCAARRRAFSEAEGRWVCFVDDDNLLSRDYIAVALQFAGSKGNVGSFGGRSVARLEGPPPENFEVFGGALAIWNGGEVVRRLGATERCFAAGLVIRSDVGKRCATEQWVVSGRIGESKLIAGEDLELCLKLVEKGFERWYVPAMVFEHALPARRLRMEYLRKVYRGFGDNHLALFPRYAPLLGSSSLRSVIILGSASLKLPLFRLCSALSSGRTRWKYQSSAWTYEGVLLCALRLGKRLISREGAPR